MENAYEIFKYNEGLLKKGIKESVFNARVEIIKRTGLYLNLLSPTTNPVMYLLERNKSFLKGALKVYAPVHVFLLLLRLRNRRSSVGKLLKKFALDLLRSVIFTIGYATSNPISRVLPVLYEMFYPKYGSWGAFVVSTIFSSFILFEGPSRWADMSIYVLGQWVQGFSYSLVKRKFVNEIPGIEKYLLSLSIGLLTYLRYDTGIKDHRREEMDVQVSLIEKVESLDMTQDDTNNLKGEKKLKDKGDNNKIVRSIDLIVGSHIDLVPYPVSFDSRPAAKLFGDK